jgi:hypothetical protein
MNMTSETVQRPFRETGLKWIAGGSVVEAIGALAVIALAIIGLAGILSETVAAIATIILGAAILTQGGAFAAGHFASAATYEAQVREPAGLSASFLSGIAGIVLGILALLGVSAPTLLSIAVIVFGGSFLLGIGGYTTGAGGTEVSATSGGQIMAGLAALVLGILAVVGVSQLTLVLVALLCLGAFALFTGSSMGARSASAVSR